MDSGSWKIGANIESKAKRYTLQIVLKNQSPWLNFWASRNADKINAWVHGNRQLSWWQLKTCCVIWFVICLQTSWATFWCGAPLFRSQIKEPMNVIWMNHVLKHARAVRANTSETNECRFTRLPIDSDLLLYLALFLRCHVIILLRAVCMRGGGAGAGAIID